MTAESAKRVAQTFAVLALLAAPASAADGPKVSLGYAFLQYLESGGGSAPLGAYLSGWGPGKTTFEIDVAWHKDEREVLDDSTSLTISATLNTFTFLGGPRVILGGKNDQPYFHLLGGARLDKIRDTSTTSWGGAAGLGVDLGTGGQRGGTRIRLGADFEMFFSEGENVKALRLTAGLTF
jgi:hypothetical protein